MCDRNTFLNCWVQDAIFKSPTSEQIQKSSVSYINTHTISNLHSTIRFLIYYCNFLFFFLLIVSLKIKIYCHKRFWHCRDLIYTRQGTPVARGGYNDTYVRVIFLSLWRLRASIYYTSSTLYSTHITDDISFYYHAYIGTHYHIFFFLRNIPRSY